MENGGMKEFILVDRSDINDKATRLMTHVDQAKELWKEIEDWSVFIENADSYFDELYCKLLGLGVDIGMIKLGGS